MATVQENWARIEARRILKAWDEETERESLQGIFSDRQAVTLGGGFMAVRGEMNAATCRKRLAYLANDPDPRREAERQWLHQRIRESEPGNA